jgi:hypothetical protein
MADQSPATAAPDTAWSNTCPQCQAQIQPVARACWQCGAVLAEPDSEHPDYRPIDPEAARSVSILVLAAIGVAAPVLFYWWILSIFS